MSIDRQMLNQLCNANELYTVPCECVIYDLLPASSLRMGDVITTPSGDLKWYINKPKKKCVHDKSRQYGLRWHDISTMSRLRVS